MDIMQPKLTRIGNMFFRRLDIPNDGIIDDYNQFIETKQNPKVVQNIKHEIKEIDNKISSETNETQIKSIDALEESKTNEDNGIEDISEGRRNRFRAKLEIGKYFHKYIVGAHGNQKKEIENNSRCRIVVPSQTDLTGAVIITGNTEEDVSYAVNKINSIVTRARDRGDFTHFVSIPFNDNSICDRFITFKTQILVDNEINKGIDEYLFQSKSKLHLTVAILLLTDQNEKNMASDILEKCHNNYIKPLISDNSLKVKLEGIDYMNDDPEQVNVLYAKVHDMSEKKCLQLIVDHIYEEFEKSGFMARPSHDFYNVNPERKVKLHVTLMNTKFKERAINERTVRPQDRGRDRDRRNATQCFDASGILSKYKDYYFGEISVESIEISIRFSSLGRNGYYSHTSRIDL